MPMYVLWVYKPGWMQKSNDSSLASKLLFSSINHHCNNMSYAFVGKHLNEEFPSLVEFGNLNIKYFLIPNMSGQCLLVGSALVSPTQILKCLLL